MGLKEDIEAKGVRGRGIVVFGPAVFMDQTKLRASKLHEVGARGKGPGGSVPGSVPENRRLFP